MKKRDWSPICSFYGKLNSVEIQNYLYKTYKTFLKISFKNLSVSKQCEKRLNWDTYGWLAKKPVSFHNISERKYLKDLTFFLSFLIVNPASGITYEVIFHTSNRYLAGSNANIYVELLGEFNESEIKHVDSSLFDTQMGRLVRTCHCVKSVRIRSYSGLYFPAFGLNMERYCGPE